MDKKTKLIKLALGDTITEEKLNHAIAVLSQDDTRSLPDKIRF